jgi:hypothetical protein
MTKARLKLIVFPSCKGTGRSPALSWRCMWCEGAKGVSKRTALQWASTLEMLAQGGYICGDHDYDDMRRMEAEAKAVRTFIAACAPAA